MLLFATLLLLTSNAVRSTDALVLRDGHRIEISGPVHEENGRLTFRGKNGTLYSLAASEVDQEATRAVAATPLVARPADPRRPLKVSEEERKRLLRDLEQNHTGRPAPSAQDLVLNPPPPGPSREQISAEKQDEQQWRARARQHEESIRQASENLGLLQSKAERLRSQIAGLVSQGFRPNQFTYQSTELQSTLEQIPYAELEVTRAKRAWDQFREDARREGILPGWLR
jgi:hypothetical protein